MNEHLPWPPRTALGALGLVTGTWLIGFLLLWRGASLGWLAMLLGGWLTAGLIYTAWRSPGDMS